MIKIGSYCNCIDTTGVSYVKIFKSNVPCYNKRVKLGDTVLVVVRAVNTKTKFLKDERVKFKFRRGSIHKAVVVHTIEKYKRANRSYIWFPKNAVVLVNRARIPFCRRLRLGIPREVANKYRIMGSMSPRIY